MVDLTSEMLYVVDLSLEAIAGLALHPLSETTLKDFSLYDKTNHVYPRDQHPVQSPLVECINALAMNCL